MASNSEFEKFNAAMKTILRTDPKLVKAQMEVEKEERQRKRTKKKAVVKPSTY
jgi:hypothetical protein